MVAKTVNKQRGSNKRKRTTKAVCFTRVINSIKKDILQKQPKTLGTAIKLAIKKVKNMKKQITKPPRGRIIKIPKTGGILPLIPIFSALGALGALSGGVAGVAKAVNDAKAAKNSLEEARRHNQKMEAIALGKGMYLKPYKTGLGLFLQPARA